MLGYVLSDTPEVWRESQKKVIDKKKVQLRLHSPQQDVIVLDALPVEWITIHERDSSEHPITVYHILLDCYSAGPQTAPL